MTTPPRQAQPETALFLRKLSPELIDTIMQYCSYPYMRSPSSHPLTPGRNVNTIALSLVCNYLSFAAARHIWRTVVLDSDVRMRRVQSIVDASGGKGGRVGSSIQAIHILLFWSRFIQEYVTLAASCPNLRRMEAPLYDFKPVSTADFQRLHTLAICGLTRSRGFNAINLVGLTGLQHLSIGTRLHVDEDCPAATFSLVSLLWEGKHDPTAVRWALKKTDRLQILLLHAPFADYLEECLAEHGHSIISLRLFIHASIGHTGYPRVFDAIRLQCPNILELLTDICPDPGVLDGLSPTIKHLALKPGLEARILKGSALVDLADSKENLLRITLWGYHVKRIVYTVEGLISRGKNKNSIAHVKSYPKKWEKDSRLEFIAVKPWPFAFPDVETQVLPALQTFFDSPDRIFNYENTLQCTCYSAGSDGDNPRRCPSSLCLATKQNLEILDTILPFLRSAMSPSPLFSAVLEETEDRAKTLRDQSAFQSQVRRRTMAWVRHTADKGALGKGADVTPSQQRVLSGSIQSLPVEVLSAVIIQAQIDNPWAMLLLSHVNGAFRDTSINTPNLWTSVNILNNDNITRLQLGLSKAARLNVSMSLPRILPPGEGTRRLAGFTSILSTHRHRITNLEAQQPYKNWVRMALHLVTSSDLPQLKSFDVGLTWTRPHSGPPEPEPERHSTKGLNLTTVSMRHVLVQSPSIFLAPSITHLKVGFTVFPTFSGMITALKVMSSLQSLHLEELDFLEDDWSLKLEHIDLPDLCDLSFVRMGYMLVSNYLLENCLQAPALRSLTLTRWDPEDYYPGHPPNILKDAEWALCGILQRSPQLRRLELIHVRLPTSAWRNAAHHLSTTVTDIRLSHCMFPGSYLFEIFDIFGPLPADGHECCRSLLSHNIIDEHTGPIFLPNLRHLTLEYEESISLEAIREALVARSKNGDAARLESLTVTGYQPENFEIEPDDLDLIREHVDVFETSLFDHGYWCRYIWGYPTYDSEEGCESDGEESESSAQFSGSSGNTDSDGGALDDGPEEDVAKGGLADEERGTGTQSDELEEMGEGDSDQGDGNYLLSDEEERSTELNIPRNSSRPPNFIGFHEEPLGNGIVHVVEQDRGTDAAINMFLSEVDNHRTHSDGSKGGSREPDEANDTAME